MKELNLSIEVTNENLNKIFDYFNIVLTNDYKIINDNKNKKLLIKDKEFILLKEHLLNNNDIIKILINEINLIKEKNNDLKESNSRLIKLNEEKDNKIQNLESKYNSLKDDLKNIIKNNDLIIKKELSFVYQCENESTENIFGEKFVSENRTNIDLIINGNTMELKDKYNLMKGENHIKIKIKNKLTNISYMFNDCKS